MGQPDQEAFRKQLFTYVSDKGFVYGPEPEIYGGVAGFYTYGPLGKALKNNVERKIREVFGAVDFWEVECPTVMPAPVWKASGHLDGFTDPLIQDTSGGVHRVDRLIEEWCEATGKDVQSLGLAGATPDQLLAIIKEHDMSAPNGKPLIMKIKAHDLMMKTTIGYDTVAYNRPETATTTYLPFLRYINFFRQKLPFGVFQIGKAYRNEISPRQHVLRCREFTQAEGQLFILRDDKQSYAPYEQVSSKELPLWTSQLQKENKQPMIVSLQDALGQGIVKSQAYIWSLYLAYDLFIRMGIPPQRLRLRQHHDDEKAFYADDAWDIEILFNTFGWVEVCGVHDRTDYDLSTHAKHSRVELSFTNEQGVKQIPHIVEIAFGVDRPVLALLDNFYAPASVGEGKPTLHIPYHMAPVQVAVFPLVNKEGIPQLAQQVYVSLQRRFVSQYDRSGSVGKRYLRQDEIGTPYCITVDHESVSNKTVTIRDRRSGTQKRVAIQQLADIIQRLFDDASVWDIL